MLRLFNRGNTVVTPENVRDNVTPRVDKPESFRSAASMVKSSPDHTRSIFTIFTVTIALFAMFFMQRQGDHNTANEAKSNESNPGAASQP